MNLFQRLYLIKNASTTISFNNSSKFIIFSDCHRADRSSLDDFAKNSDIFLTAMNHYYNEGYTYIEAGDGDELWEVDSFSNIISSYKDVFLLLKKFYDENRFYMIYGNHDIYKSCSSFVKMNIDKSFNSFTRQYDSFFPKMKIHQGLSLMHNEIPLCFFIIHGHQGDFLNEDIWPLTMLFVKIFGRQLKLSPKKCSLNKRVCYEDITLLEKNFSIWAKKNNLKLIAGHTHNPIFHPYKNIHYFNTGCCTRKGYITGIEISNGNISLISWSKYKNGSGFSIVKEILEGPIYFDKLI